MNRPIPPTLGGVSDHFSYEDQPPTTSTDAENVASVDPVTNRVRLSQRGGYSRLSDERLSGSGKVQALATVTHDGRQTTFENAVTSAPGDLTDWARRLSQSEPCNAVKVDAQGNVYALNGNAALSKFNSAGVLLWDFSFPTKAPNHVVRVLDIDEVGQIYVAVSEGTSNQGGAWIRCYIDDVDRDLVELWEILPGGFTTQVRVVNNKLYAAVNFPDRRKAKIQVYQAISSVEPILQRTKHVSFPVHDIDVKTNGDVFTASPSFVERAYDPLSPTTTVIIDEPRWAPVDLELFEDRVHCWLSGETVAIQPGWADVQENDDITEWRDMLGKGNVVFNVNTQPPSVDYLAPKYVKHGLGGRPSIRFHSEDCSLVTQGSLGTSASLADSQPTVVPASIGYALFMVLRITDERTPSLNGIQIFHQEDDETTPGAFPGHNRNALGILGNGHVVTLGSDEVSFVHSASEVGEISLWADRRASPGVSYSAPWNGIGDFVNGSNAVIVTVISDGNAAAGVTPNFSTFRVNGVPLAKYEATRLATTLGRASILGRFQDGGPNFSVFSNRSAIFEISEMICLRQYTDADDVERVCEFPDYNTLSDGGAGSEPAVDPASDTECERIEGYLAWKYGIAHLLDDGSVDAATSPTFDADGGHSQYEHPFTYDPSTLTGSPPNPDGRDADTLDNTLWTSEDGILAKWSAQRNAVKWAFTGAGVGYAVRLASDGNLYCVGARVPGGDNHTICKMPDRNGLITPSWVYSNSVGGVFLDYENQFPRIAVDEFDNVWVPYSYVGNQDYTLLAFTKAQAIVTAAQPFISYVASSSDNQKGRAVAVDPRTPDYSNQDTALTRPEHVVIGMDEGQVVDANKVVLASIHVINAIANNAAPRITSWVGVAGGDIVEFTGGPVTLIQAGALASNATLVSAVSAFSKVYFADGVTYKVYDPKDGSVDDWESNTEGSIPDRCALLAFWRGRMVLARGTGDPQNWHMSAVGDPHDWNQFPANGPLATQAISGNNSDVGAVPDIINCLIPYDRDRLIFGGDHTIHMLWSDPMVDGRMVMLSDITGIALGSGWTKDTEGIMYFYGSRGGVFAMMPGGNADLVTNQPNKISSQSVDKRISEIDLSTHTMQMVWNDADQSLHVYQVPYGPGGVLVEHWRWEKKTAAWWPVTFSNADVQPTAVAIFDGDGVDDRVVAVGCEDGFVRTPSASATTDDGHPIDSYVTIGPWFDPSGAVRLRNPKVVLARDQGGCNMELFSGDTPDVLGAPQASVRLGPGQNPTQFIGVRGAYAWMRLRNAAQGQRWAFESGVVDARPAGRRVAP